MRGVRRGGKKPDQKQGGRCRGKAGQVGGVYRVKRRIEIK